ncbi:MAG: DUF1854 domain-containing protein [Tepidisphaeraceae bacterium]|jgi:uncharacterized protein DUF1854
MGDAFSLTKDLQGRLVLGRAGMEDVVDVRIRRAFPWSCPTRHISVRTKEGKELVMIDDVTALPDGLRTILLGEMASTTLIPLIQRVMKVDVRFGFQQWTVATDRGAAEFRVQEREDIRFMPDGRFTVKDADGNLYELGPLSSLDEHSRRAVEAVV